MQLFLQACYDSRLPFHLLNLSRSPLIQGKNWNWNKKWHSFNFLTHSSVWRNSQDLDYNSQTELAFNRRGLGWVKKTPVTPWLTQTNTNSPTPIIPQGWASTGLRAPDRRVNVTLPLSTAGQDIYLFWLAGRVCEVILTHTHAHTASELQTGLPWSSPSSCDCQKETGVLWKARSKFILYLLERLLHFTVHLSLRLERGFARSAKKRQTPAIVALFLEASFLAVEKLVCGDIELVNWGVQQQDDGINPVTQTWNGLL